MEWKALSYIYAFLSLPQQTMGTEVDVNEEFLCPTRTMTFLVHTNRSYVGGKTDDVVSFQNELISRNYSVNGKIGTSSKYSAHLVPFLYLIVFLVL